MRQFSGTFGRDCNKKKVEIPSSHPNQIPPLYPYSQSSGSPQQTGQQNFTPSIPIHTQSLSQSSCFSFNLLPSMSPSLFWDSSSTSISDLVLDDVLMEEMGGNFHSLFPLSSFESGMGSCLMGGESLPPRKTQKQSSTEIPLEFSSLMRSSSSLVLGRGSTSLNRQSGPSEKPAQFVGRGSSWERGSENGMEELVERKTEEEMTNDLFSTYLNLDDFDAFYSSGTGGDKGTEHPEVLDGRVSGTETTEVDTSSTKRRGIKRSAEDDLAPTMKHYRSIYVDSSMGMLNFGDKSSQIPSSYGPSVGQLSSSNSMDGNTTRFTLQLSNENFDEAELTKIMADEKLADITLTNPKHAKRILSNRQSAARSKERKTQYILEMKHKVQTLQTKAAELSTQLKFLQRDFFSLTNKNNEIKFRLQALEEKSKLQEALNEALSVEIQHLRLTSTEMCEESVNDMISQFSVNTQMFPMHQHQNAMHQQQHVMHQEQHVMYHHAMEQSQLWSQSL